ncbi:MAG TPA: DUF3892 domain-containing protein [Nitrospira sp.]|nr:DUF3892 domain-containing protein [Nitrospira sp.]
MGDVQVTCMTKPNPDGPHEEITHIGSMKGTWKWRREQVIASIELGTNTFYVLDPRTNKRSEVGVVRRPGQPPYLRTHVDGNWNDDLLALTQCP